MALPKTEHCGVCGSPLQYLERAEPLTCTFCGTAGEAHIKCPQGHVLCDACHGRDVRQTIEEMARGAESGDPLEIAETMLGLPALPMLGCEHAFIAAGALLAALRKVTSGKITNEDIREVFARIARQAHGGFCGLTGVCGIVPAIGASVSMFLGAKCGADTEQRITMDAAIRTAQAVAELTGPSCCKAYVRGALKESAAFFAERLGIVLPVKDVPVRCRHASRHPHGCRAAKCPFYYEERSKDVLADSIHLPVMICPT